MPYSRGDFKDDIVEYLTAREDADTMTILDVGAGSGKFGRLLGMFPVDCVEAHQPYITEFDLPDFYRHVYHDDVREFDTSEWDVVIFGDVLEHLTVEDARDVLDRTPGTVIVQVPYHYPQSGQSVEWENHHQPDLDEGVFHSRYPGFTTLMSNHRTGVFVRPALAEVSCASD